VFLIRSLERLGGVILHSLDCLGAGQGRASWNTLTRVIAGEPSQASHGSCEFSVYVIVYRYSWLGCFGV
jgi:hypothetical protein